MRARQRGITFIGWIVLLVPVAIVGYAGLRVVPLYLNYMKVARALEQLREENKNSVSPVGGEQVNVQAMRKSLQSRFDVDSVDYPRPDQIGFVREGKDWFAEARYEDVAPLFSNLSILVRFEKRVPLT
ncbi:MAG: DUF4845 domain-containing protein [Proteobacteria bacterium]|nr:MAG: DUF4845 domain-containing protein [Pseudomonadota bacterium]